jgi:hypothetical protein
MYRVLRSSTGSRHSTLAQSLAGPILIGPYILAMGKRIAQRRNVILPEELQTYQVKLLAIIASTYVV